LGSLIFNVIGRRGPVALSGHSLVRWYKKTGGSGSLRTPVCIWRKVGHVTFDELTGKEERQAKGAQEWAKGSNLNYSSRSEAAGT